MGQVMDPRRNLRNLVLREKFPVVSSDFNVLNRIPAMAPPVAPPFWGAHFKGTYLPKKRVHCPHLEGER